MFVKKNHRKLILLGSGIILILAIWMLAGCSAQPAQGTVTESTPVVSSEPAPASTPEATQTANQNQEDQCVGCHQTQTPGVIDQYHDSKHSAKGIGCIECHKPVQGQNNMAEQHNGFTIVVSPTPNNCAVCHANEVQQFADSRHGGRAWYPVVGASDFTQEDLAKNHVLDADGKPMNGGNPNGMRGVITDDAAALSCEVCHGIGKKNPDGSFGDCTKCHLRHDFSVSDARQPEICAQCHLGPDHPQSEIYNESAHGAYYHANKDKFNLDAPAGKLTTQDFPAPTCATCHMSAFGGVPGTHDVGQRLKWNLAPPIASLRNNGDKNRQTMEQVCSSCHTQDFIDTQMTAADKVVDLSNENVKQGQAIVADLKKDGYLTSPPMSTPVDFIVFELWHHEGRRARNGALMGAADYVNWHGIYDQKKALAELNSEAEQMRANH